MVPQGLQQQREGCFSPYWVSIVYYGASLIHDDYAVLSWGPVCVFAHWVTPSSSERSEENLCVIRSLQFSGDECEEDPIRRGSVCVLLPAQA